LGLALGARPALAWINPGFETGTGAGWLANLTAIAPANAPVAYVATNGSSPYPTNNLLNRVHSGNYSGGVFSGNGDPNHGDSASIFQSDTVPAGTTCLSVYLAAALNGYHYNLGELATSDAYVLFQVTVGGLTVYSQRLTWYDVTGQLLDPGAPYDAVNYISPDGVHGPWKYLPWTQYYFDMSAYVGQTCTITYSAYSCDQVEHYSFGYIDDVAWSSCPPTATITPTWSASPTATPSATNTLSFTSSPSFTQTPTQTETPSGTETPSTTPTPTETGSFTVTLSATPSSSPSPSDTASGTPTETGSFTETPSSTATPSATDTASATPSSSVTATPSDSPSSTVTPSVTLTATPTPTGTATATQTDSPSNTATPSDSSTCTPSPTSTDTSSITPSCTATSSGTQTPTLTATPSDTASATETLSSTATPSSTESPTCTDSPTLTLTRTVTPSATPSWTFTATPSVTATPTRTPTRTVTPTFSASATRTPTRTITPTSSITPTFSASPTATHTMVPMPYQLTLSVYNSAGERVKLVYVGGVSAWPGNSTLSPAIVSAWSGAGSAARLMLPGVTPDGSSSIGWDGSNQQSQPVANGTYTMKMDIQDQYGDVTTVTLSVLVLRPAQGQSISIFNGAGERVGQLALPADADLNSLTLEQGSGSEARLDYQSPSGGGQVVWTGLNPDGSRIANGSYLLRAQGPDGSKALAFTLLRGPVDGGRLLVSPNPVLSGEDRLRMDYAVPDGGLTVHARLYNLAGELVREAIDPVGNGTLWMTVSGLSSGIYLVVLDVDGPNAYRQKQKVALVR
jgi:hypothetical protein